MYRLLSDLRILQLALHLEETLERYEESLRGLLPQVPVRAKLSILFQGGPAHDELRRLHQELSRQAQASEFGVDAEDVLQSMVECERIAHDFYVHQLDHLSDPRLVTLFKALAIEERGHARAVEEAVEILRTLPRSDPEPEAS